MSVQAKAFLLLAAFLIGLGAGWRVESWHLTSKYEAEKRVQLEVNQKAFAALVADRDAKDARLTASNDKYLKQWRAAQNETNRLRNSDSVGLRIAAICPTTGSPPKATGYASVDTGTGAELDVTSRRAYYALRDGIDQVEAKLAACQSELRIRQ